MNRPLSFGRKKRLGDLLVEAGVITEEQLQKALDLQKGERKGTRLGNLLVDLGYTSDKKIVKALEQQLGIESVYLQI